MCVLLPSLPWCLRGLLVLCVVSPLSCLPPSPCPPGCCCPRPGLLVLCESLGLRALPRSVPLSTSVLSVARNQLCNVDHLLRRFSGLQELSLSHNQLGRFPRGLPPSLQRLLLEDNRITYITSGALRQLGNLTRLDLEDNRIRAIQPGALRGLGRLQVLTLKGNRLTSLPLELPSSLTHLDLSANCISDLDFPSLAALVNLQVLKINSNCLRSVPERAFDRMPLLRSMELADNLWVCECDILYLYRWLLGGGLKMATDMVCVEPQHLAHRLLLNLSVTAICPRVLKTNENVPSLSFTPRPERRLAISTEETTTPDLSSSTQKILDVTLSTTESHVGESDPQPKARMLPDHHTLQVMSYEDCLALNSTTEVNPPPQIIKPTPSLPVEEPRCLDNSTGRYLPNSSTSVEAVPPGRTGPSPTPRTLSLQGSPAVIALLAVLCVLVVLLTLAVLLVLKTVLLHHQRVAPLQQS
ncbi:oligodendrocyte-myelin glycoprotein [Osmerus eperlanus]|uniref:oligodendrocyte-myelin glycoprotein n=1 Tax=Osmerus eperlanus TaxID=29151 RepID=UPI002E108FBF